jgi:hypothetical protein
MTRHAIIVRLGRSFEIIGSPPVGNVGDAYSYTFGTTGGLAPVTWTHSSLGSSGLSFNDSTGVLSGTPTASGSFPFTLTATDSNQAFASASFVLIILGTTVVGLITEDPDDFDIITEASETMIAE